MKWLCYLWMVFAISFPGLAVGDNPKNHRTSDSDANTNGSAGTNQAANPTAPVIIYVSPSQFPQTQSQTNQNATSDNAKNANVSSGNKWTDPITILTVILAITSIGLVYISQKQAWLTRENAISTQRAFVFLKGIQFGQNLDPATNSVNGGNIAAVWENSGDTPTRRMNTVMNLRIETTDLPYHFDFADNPSERRFALCPPKAVVAMTPLTISLEQMDGIIAGTLHCHVWGWTEYNDVFIKTRRHRTEFACKVVLGGNARTQNGLSVASIILAQHNGANEECMRPLQTK